MASRVFKHSTTVQLCITTNHRFFLISSWALTTACAIQLTLLHHQKGFIAAVITRSSSWSQPHMASKPGKQHSRNHNQKNECPTRYYQALLQLVDLANTPLTSSVRPYVYRAWIGARTRGRDTCGIELVIFHSSQGGSKVFTKHIYVGFDIQFLPYYVRLALLAVNEFERP